MKFLKEQDKGTVRDIDKNCKNKWAWKWTDEELVLKLKGQDIPYKLGDCIKKEEEIINPPISVVFIIEQFV